MIIDSLNMEPRSQSLLVMTPSAGAIWSCQCKGCVSEIRQCLTQGTVTVKMLRPTCKCLINPRSDRNAQRSWSYEKKGLVIPTKHRWPEVCSWDFDMGKLPDLETWWITQRRHPRGRWAFQECLPDLPWWLMPLSTWIILPNLNKELENIQHWHFHKSDMSESRDWIQTLTVLPR